ncbi:MAG: asparagine synthase-related protein [Patescibacteria group bacterium]|nr:asparagine synthase-related protein [Patescibacteria group bacterium]
MRKHFYFQISWEELQTKDIDYLLSKVTLPSNSFPERFLVKREEMVLGGYFVSYFPKISLDKLANLLLENNGFHEVANLNANFVIFLIDTRKKDFLILSDQTGRFPCYVYENSKGFVVSTSFRDVLGSIAKPSLDIEGALEFILGDTSIRKATIIKNLWLLPPGMLARFKNGKCEIISLFRNEKIIESKKTFESKEEFIDWFIFTLEESVKDRLKALKNEHLVCADISSGFDSSLICYLLSKNHKGELMCYSEISKFAYGDTDPAIVLDFAKKHGLKVKFFEYDEIFPFSTKEDLNFILQEGPSYIQKSQVDAFFKFIKKDGINVRFNGEGGDEAYWSTRKSLRLKVKFPIHTSYFRYQSMAQEGVGGMLTDKALGILLDRGRFRKKVPYASVIPQSATYLSVIMFPFVWEANVWPISPFVDTRVIEVTSMVPFDTIKDVSKRDLLKRRRDIFVDSQFKEKVGTEEHYGRFLTDKKDFILNLLENSLLGEKGYIFRDRIINDLKEDREGRYLEDNNLRYITNLLELEYFLQQRGIEVA